MDYTLQRSRRRKRLALRVNPDGQVIAHAPFYLPRYFIERFIQKSQDWVERQRHRWKTVAAQPPPRQFVSGEEFHRWGEVVTLHVNPSAPQTKSAGRFSENHLQVEVPSTIVNSASAVALVVRNVYQRETESRLPELIEKYAVLLGARPVVVKVVEQKRRWGSCSRKGSLRFNWRLSMFAPEILEYVVVHELAHLKQPNHSKAFWAVVASVLPEYKLRRRALRLSAVHGRM